MFITCAKEFIRMFGITDWQITFQQHKFDGTNAKTLTDLQARKACLTFTTEWKDEWVDLSDNTIRLLALHEVIHLVLAPLSDLLGEDRKISDDEKIIAEHGIIQRLIAGILVSKDESGSQNDQTICVKSAVMQ